MTHVIARSRTTITFANSFLNIAHAVTAVLLFVNVEKYLTFDGARFLAEKLLLFLQILVLTMLWANPLILVLHWFPRGVSATSVRLMSTK
jgi:hypothetical protein